MLTTATVKVHSPGELRAQVDGRDFVELDGASVDDVLQSLAGDYPVLGKRLFNGDGKLNRFVNIYLNDEDIRFLQNLETLLESGDEISIVPAIAGGSGSRSSCRD
jgi:molybdopterin synthase sulfur carrier subunit